MTFCLLNNNEKIKKLDLEYNKEEILVLLAEGLNIPEGKTDKEYEENMRIWSNLETINSCKFFLWKKKKLNLKKTYKDKKTEDFYELISDINTHLFSDLFNCCN